MSLMIDTPAATVGTEKSLAHWARGRERSVLRDLVRLAARPGILSMAGGLPDSRLFPARQYAEAVTDILGNDPRSLQYSPSFEPLKEAIVALMARRGVTCGTDEIVLTTGAQQGIDICCRLFVEPGAAIAVEEWVYSGLLQALAPLQAELVVADVEWGVGAKLDRWREAWEEPMGAGRGQALSPSRKAGSLKQSAHGDERPGPAAAYVIPDAHNPLGMSWTKQRRHELADLVAAHGRVIIEDDPYGHLWFDRPFAPPIKALAPDHVVYLGSFSKILAPGLRLGWMVLPHELAVAATVAKELSDLECAGLTQRVAHRLLAPEIFDEHLENVRSVYSERCAVMLEELHRWPGGRARFIEPSGGLFIWGELDGIDTMSLLHRALADFQVAFVPGVVFSTRDLEKTSSLRLSFATMDKEEIREAVRRLGRCIDAFPA